MIFKLPVVKTQTEYGFVEITASSWSEAIENYFKGEEVSDLIITNSEESSEIDRELISDYQNKRSELYDEHYDGIRDALRNN